MCFNPNFCEAEKKNVNPLQGSKTEYCWMLTAGVGEEFRKSNIWTLAVRSSVWTFTDLQYLLRLRVFVTTFFFSPSSGLSVPVTASDLWNALLVETIPLYTPIIFKSTSPTRWCLNSQASTWRWIWDTEAWPGPLSWSSGPLCSIYLKEKTRKKKHHKTVIFLLGVIWGQCHSKLVVQGESWVRKHDVTEGNDLCFMFFNMY